MSITDSSVESVNFGVYICSSDNDRFGIEQILIKLLRPTYISAKVFFLESDTDYWWYFPRFPASSIDAIRFGETLIRHLLTNESLNPRPSGLWVQMGAPLISLVSAPNEVPGCMPRTCGTYQPPIWSNRPC